MLEGRGNHEYGLFNPDILLDSTEEYIRSFDQSSNGAVESFDGILTGPVFGNYDEVLQELGFEFSVEEHPTELEPDFGIGFDFGIDFKAVNGKSKQYSVSSDNVHVKVHSDYDMPSRIEVDVDCETTADMTDADKLLYQFHREVYTEPMSTRLFNYVRDFLG